MEYHKSIQQLRGTGIGSGSGPDLYSNTHSLHYEQAKLCMEHGKNVLVEKAFTANARQAEELFAMAEEKKVFITEAIWTRYMPSREIITGLLRGRGDRYTADFGSGIFRTKL